MTKQLPGYNWLTVRVETEFDPTNPVYDGGIDLVLTANERSKAALVTAQLERNRIERNKADDERMLSSIKLS